MKRLFLLPLIVFAAALAIFPQSGRRITNPQPTYTAPVQPPVNPEPPPKTAKAPEQADDGGLPLLAGVPAVALLLGLGLLVLRRR